MMENCINVKCEENPDSIQCILRQSHQYIAFIYRVFSLYQKMNRESDKENNENVHSHLSCQHKHFCDEELLISFAKIYRAHSSLDPFNSTFCILLYYIEVWLQ